jgi:hypothetical protein
MYYTCLTYHFWFLSAVLCNSTWRLTMKKSVVQSRRKVVTAVVPTRATIKGLMVDDFPEHLHSYRIDRPTFTLYLGGDPSHSEGHDSGSGLCEPGVEYMMADRFELNLHTLSAIDSKRPILVQMSSCALWFTTLRTPPTNLVFYLIHALNKQTFTKNT